MRKERYSIAFITAAFLSGMFMTAVTSAWDDGEDSKTSQPPVSTASPPAHVASATQQQSF